MNGGGRTWTMRAEEGMHEWRRESMDDESRGGRAWMMRVEEGVHEWRKSAWMGSVKK